MPTYADLRVESWWNREVVTAELDWLGDELCRRTGRPRSACGTKGDNRHLRGAHRSQEWILRSRYARSRSYTVQSGLTALQRRYVCGVDFTPGAWGSRNNERLMIAQTGRLIRAMRAGQLDEVREVFGTTNGHTVTGWSNVANRRTSSDRSHLEHWHLTIDRRHCADRSLMRRIVAIVLGTERTVRTAPRPAAPAPVRTTPVVPVRRKEDGVSRENVIDGLRTAQPYQSAGVGRLAKRMGMKPVSQRALSEYTWATVQNLATQQAVLLAKQQELLGRAPVDEQRIIDGVLAGLGARDLDDVATALRAAFGDRTAELAAKLTRPDG
ncbi:hypothetical protein [Plantactinospora endophytica]|uniref:Uncharacterized protein n=1 Tax=Plantactinospora endophytica TaxID=673535 RepID=A0ABQ4E526_9ACTN|nr:hypothetical protein [Plantactinospora endophytica]GIG89796.1 hypothetical protein Pen02_47320 [Plantactinospora endophytica]